MKPGEWRWVQMVVQLRLKIGLEDTNFNLKNKNMGLKTRTYTFQIENGAYQTRSLEDV